MLYSVAAKLERRDRSLNLGYIAGGEFSSQLLFQKHHQGQGGLGKCFL